MVGFTNSNNRAENIKLWYTSQPLFFVFFRAQMKYWFNIEKCDEGGRFLILFFCDLARLSNIHKEDVAKFGYRSNIKVKKNLQNSLIVWLPAGICCRNLVMQILFVFFFQTLVN
jgi:hypothetical protein